MNGEITTTQKTDKWSIAAFHNTSAQYLERPDQSQALTEELRKEL